MEFDFQVLNEKKKMGEKETRRGTKKGVGTEKRQSGGTPLSNY